MPTVPLVSTTTVEARSGGGGGYLSVGGADSPEAFGAGVGRAQQQFGAQVEKVGDVFARHAITLQDRANEAWANDAFVQSTQALGEQMEWLKSQTGQNAAKALPDFYKKSEELREKFMADAPNAEAARRFDMDFKRRAGFLNVDAGNYAGTQNRAYNVAASRGKQAVGLQMAGEAQEENQFRSALQIVREGALAEQENSGLPPEVKEAELNTKEAQAWQTHLAGIAMRDPFRAEKVFNANKDQIRDPRVRQEIDRNLLQQKEVIGSKMVSSAIENGASIPYVPGLGGGGDRAAITSVETGHIKDEAKKYTAEGPVVPTGRYAGQRAIGRYQIMEGNIPQWTEEALGKRMTPEEFKNDKEAQDKTFDFQFGKLKEKYGNFPDAASAWHSGRPLAEATAAGATDGYSKTADYVKRATAALGAGDGAGPLTTSSGPEWLSKATEQARKAAQILAPEHPSFENTLVSRVTTAYRQVQQQTQQVERENFNEIKGVLLDRDARGLPVVTSMDQIWNNPVMNRRFFALDKGRQNQVVAQVEKNSKADIPQSDATEARFDTVMGMARTEPQKFLELDPLKENLPYKRKSDIFAAQRSMLTKQQDIQGLTRDLGTVRDMTRQAGVYPEKDNQARNDQYNQFVGAFEAERADAIKNNGGKPLGSEQVRQIASQILRKTTPAVTDWFGRPRARDFFDSDEQRHFEIPAEQLEVLRKDIRETFKREPTPSDVYRLYQIRQRNAPK